MKLNLYTSKSNENIDDIKQAVLSVVPSCSSNCTSVVCYPRKKHNSDDLMKEAKRLSDLMFTRTELVNRQVTGSYIISKDEAMNELLNVDEKSEKIEDFLRLQERCKDVRYRRVICRFIKDHHQVFNQAELQINSENGCYFVYVNLIPSRQKWYFFNLVTCLAIEKDQNHGLRVVFSVFGEDTDHESSIKFADLVAKQFCFWLDSGKLASFEAPIRQIDAKTYFDFLMKVRSHEVVKDLSNKWEKYEKTEKSKHLFEDVGIVSYLAALFKKLDLNRVSFVDVGCGNGVNTYLLNSVFGDKIKGIGYDVKDRKIWKYYEECGQRDIFQVQPIVPKWPDLDQPFPAETNFIVGVHTDELTPWIPLFAMKRHCNFMIVPCCRWDFYGKFNNPSKNKSKSKWPYLDHIVSIAEKLGYIVKIDVLKIPSEKRTAIVGILPDDGKLLMDTNKYWEIIVDQMLTPSLKANGFRPFQARPAVEKVKNITSVPRSAMDKIVAELVKILEPYGKEGAKLSEVAKQLPEDLMVELKEQNGGLQTLIKIHKGGFTLDKGMVKIRDTVYEKYLLPNRAKAPCFFDKFMTCGCQFRDVCGFRHADESC